MFVQIKKILATVNSRGATFLELKAVIQYFEERVSRRTISIKAAVLIAYSGDIDGINRDYVLSNELVSGSDMFFYNGSKMSVDQYTISGLVVTFIFTPQGEGILEFYGVPI